MKIYSKIEFLPGWSVEKAVLELLKYKKEVRVNKHGAGSFRLNISHNLGELR